VLPDRGPLAADLEAAGVEVLVRPSLSVIRRSLASPAGAAAIGAAAARDAAALRPVVAAREVALVHSNTSVVLGGAAVAALARVPHVWHLREIYARFGRAWPPFRRVLRSAAALPCVSEATAAQFAGTRGRGPVRVIYDGLAVEPTRVEREQARRALGLEPDVPAIAVLGRITDWKGQDVLVRALAEPALRERGAVGLLAGEVWPGANERLERVLALARERGVADRVRLLGFRDDVETVYGAADVVAVPSSAPDPLPGAAIEAAAAGCAVLASAHGGLPEIIRDGETGRLFAPGDPSALAAGAAALLDDAGLRRRLGEAAAADVRARFDPALLRVAVQALYDELLAPR
jgi:glycosyltransferase involved in cell wall biosynthesis